MSLPELKPVIVMDGWSVENCYGKNGAYYHREDVRVWAQKQAEELKSAQGDLLFGGIEQAKVKIQKVRNDLERV